MSKKSSIPKMPWAASHLWQLNPRSLIVISVAMALMGIGDGLLVLANFGSSPWTVFAQGLSLQTGLSIGWIIAIISVVVLLFWLPLKLKPGLGTILNVLIIAIFVDLTVHYVSVPQDFATRVGVMLFGIVLFGISTSFYLSCQLGAGPRDGLMVGLCAKYGWRIGVVRTTLEVGVCIFGFLLGGTIGLSTLAFALGVGWIIEITLKVFATLCRCLTLVK